MTDAKTASGIPPAPIQKSFIQSIKSTSFIGWAIRLSPIVLATSIVYSKQGAFQTTRCGVFGIQCPKEPIPVQGMLARDHYAPMVGYYTKLFEYAHDLGGSLAVFVEGKPVIDIQAGFKDLERTKPYTNETLNQVYSSGKVIESIMIAKLVEKGLLDYESPVMKYWPEFGQNGKEEIRLVDLLTHECGLSDWNMVDLSWALVHDEAKFSDFLAKQPPVWESKRAYMGINRGYYLNEIIKRVDPHHRTLGKIVQEELMIDYPDLEFYYSRLPKGEEDWENRLSPMRDYPMLRIAGRMLIPQFLQTHPWVGIPNMVKIHNMIWQIIQPKTQTARALSPKWLPGPDSFRSKAAHIVEGTSYSLKTNAHSIGRIAAMMSLRGKSVIDNEPDLMNATTFAKASALYSTEYDNVIHETFPLSTAGWLTSTDYYNTGDVNVSGWAGAGGSMFFWVEELQLGFAYVTNAMGGPESPLGDFRGKTLLQIAVELRQSELKQLREATEAL